MMQHNWCEVNKIPSQIKHAIMNMLANDQRNLTNSNCLFLIQVEPQDSLFF